MDKRSQYLATLGLPPEASWDEVTQAYKDLMRVWHPDRFQGDERLRLKAEAQAQRINEAMSELRKLGKEVHHRVKPTPPSSSPTNRSSTAGTTQRSSSTRHSGDFGNRATNQTTADQSATGSSSFIIAPLHIRQRLTTSLFRVLGASAVVFVAWGALENPAATPQHEAGALSFAFLALDFGLRNLTLLLIPKPIVSVERSGLFFLKTGQLSWGDIESAWPVMTPRHHQLSLLLSEGYIRRRNFLTRLFLRFRRWVKTPHVVIPFTGLTADPVSVINAMKLRQLHRDVTIEPPPTKSLGWIMALLAVSALCATAAIARALLGLTDEPIDYLPYLAIFGVARVTGTILRILRN